VGDEFASHSEALSQCWFFSFLLQAGLIHTKTGDAEMTKRIVTVGIVAAIVIVITVLGHTGVETANYASNIAKNQGLLKNEPDIEPKLKDPSTTLTRMSMPKHHTIAIEGSQL